ncbi:hypothetical protein [Tenuibacillus multivorans]|uniref:Uncharacterized protein n=1 Tax=Tenuibacillus multivorans TaxID=237069 RepID=A0A1H0B5J4_9BACI|nr:hypothetical protein [Tenuibacillus multivorans]GEL78637.1 hypothetical protein TMU01_28720 [Tenuibacillus multivorans]SDN40894.1 hypothetical protein SAMN05216498_2227 [Tenuibacillus multivorans]
MVKQRLKQELDDMIGKDKLFNQEQKQAIFNRIESGGHSEVKSKRPFFMAGLTIAVVSIAVVLFLSEVSFAPNKGKEAEESTHPVETEESEPVQDETKEPEDTNEYTSLQLTDELDEIYQQYAQTHDEKLLEGLKPFDIFRLYHESMIQFDRRTEFELYYQEGQYFPYDEFEPFATDLAMDEVGKQNYRDFYQELLTIDQFEIEYVSDHEALIHYEEPTEGNPLSFRVVKNSNGVWKIPWIPFH